MNTIVGTCGNCGGAVSVPAVWFGVVPPTPTCEHCGSTAKPNHGPVLPMNQGRTKTSNTASIEEIVSSLGKEKP